MKFKKYLLLSACALLTQSVNAADGLPVTVISAYDTMKFSVTKIAAQPGQKLTVELKNEGNIPKEVMGHNWILLKAGSDATAYQSAAMSAKADNYMPKSLADKVLAFTVPDAPGSYPFLCSFPGHCQAGMTGTLMVK